MKEAWTGELVGKMHVAGVKLEDIANELGCSKGYVSLILNGARTPIGARERLNAAFETVVQRKGAE